MTADCTRTDAHQLADCPRYTFTSHEHRMPGAAQDIRCAEYLYNGTRCLRPAVAMAPTDFGGDPKPVCGRHDPATKARVAERGARYNARAGR